VSNPIPFRPTEQARNIIKTYMKEHSLKSRSQAVNEIIEKSATQLEPSEKLGDATGTIINCPLRPLPIPLEKPFATWKVPVDSSVCRTCDKYPCETWKQQFSWERINPKAAHATTPCNKTKRS